MINCKMTVRIKSPTIFIAWNQYEFNHYERGGEGEPFGEYSANSEHGRI